MAPSPSWGASEARIGLCILALLLALAVDTTSLTFTVRLCLTVCERELCTWYQLSDRQSVSF